jgi:hypothetical protein
VDLVVGLGFPVLDLTVPLVQPASSIAITAAMTRAEPRRVGRMTPVCHRPTVRAAATASSRAAAGRIMACSLKGRCSILVRWNISPNGWPRCPGWWP